jgi:hypothetical protein
MEIKWFSFYNVQIFGFSKLVKIGKLKKITVQTSFTRNEPIDIDSILQEQNEYEYNVERQSVSKNNFWYRRLERRGFIPLPHGERLVYGFEFNRISQKVSK